MGETLTGPGRGHRVGDVLTTDDGAHWYVERLGRGGSFTAVPYDPTMPRWSQPGADPARDFAQFTATVGAAGAAPLTRVTAPARGILTLILADRRYLADPKTDGPGYTLHDYRQDWAL